MKIFSNGRTSFIDSGVFMALLPYALFILFKNGILSLLINKNGKYKALVNEIETAGYAVVGQEYGETTFPLLNDSIMNVILGKVLDSEGQGNGRVLNLHHECDVINSYCQHLKLIAQEYFDNTNIDVEMTLYQRSVKEEYLQDIPGGESFHMDDSKKTLKFFLYLTDVDISNGPFCYAPKSQGIFYVEKFLRFLNWNIFKNNRSLYITDENKIINTYGKTLITEKKGTIFCADTTGYHKAMPVLDGVREVFVVSFNEKRGGVPLFLKKYLTTK